MRLIVHGVPAPQGSKTRMPNGAMVEAGSKVGREKLKSWRSAMVEAARDFMDANPGAWPIDEPVALNIGFRFPLPKSDPYRTFHTGTPDIDKLIRATFDPLKIVGMLRDDSLVYSIDATKEYARPGEWTGAYIAIHLRGKWEAEHRERRKAEAKAARKAS